MKEGNFTFSVKFCYFLIFSLICLYLVQKKYESYFVDNVYSHFWSVSSNIRLSINNVDKYLSKQKILIDENEKLKNQNSILMAKIYRLYSLQNQNVQLRKILSSSANIGGDYLVAQLLAIFKNLDSINVAINKGKSSAIYKGQPVVDGYGVIGQVIKVFSEVSIVQFITDSNSAVPVLIKNKGIRGVAKGFGNNDYIKLIDVTNKEGLNIGDVLVTSGLGLQFVAGYPVGVICSISKESILIKPLAHLERSNHYLLIWPENSRWLEVINSKRKD